MPVFEAFRLALQTIRAQKLKSGFSLLGVFIGVASLIAAWSIVNGVNRYMTEKFAQTLYGVNTFQLRRRPMFAANVPDSVWRAWRRRPRIKFSDAEAVTAALTMPVVTASPSDGPSLPRRIARASRWLSWATRWPSGCSSIGHRWSAACGSAASAIG